MALTGDGGDELFAGYPRYRAVQVGAWFDRLPAAVRKVLAGDFWQRLPASPRQRCPRRRFKKLVGALNKPAGRRYLDWISIFDESRRGGLYTDAFLERLPDSDPYQFLATALGRSRGRDPLTATSLADLVTYLPGDLNCKVDIASMANSLECRQPFLDHHVVELAAAMPIELKYRGFRGKRVLTETFADLLPPAIIKRRKMGFGVPLDHWFRNELKDYTRQVLLDPATLARGYFRPAAVEQLLNEHINGQFDHAYRLWALLFLELWQREWQVA